MPVTQDKVDGDVDDHSGPYSDIFMGTQRRTTLTVTPETLA